MKSLTTRTLDYTLVRPRSLRPRDASRMYELMTENYDCVTEEQFTADLREKAFVGLLIDERKSIQGFSTFSINPAGCGTPAYNVVFSGDTIISPGFRGTQELVRGWCTTVGGLLAAEPDKPLYWLLISKGDRTYMYLPLFFRSFSPSADSEKEDPSLKDITHHAASKAFGEAWDPERGILHYPESHGHMKPDLVQATWEREDNRHVGFFLSKNPGFAKGDELVCMARIHPDNMRGMAKRYVMMGLEQGLQVDEPGPAPRKSRPGKAAS